MKTQDIIAKFRTWVDDGSELSAQDELDLLNKVYRLVWTKKAWEFSKKDYSANISGTEVSLPTDFAYICENASFTDNQTNNLIGNSTPKIVWVGTTYYIVINWSDRMQYDGKQGYCYIDIRNKKLKFTTNVSGLCRYDYVFFPDDLELDDEPLFPAAYHHCLYHLMAADDYVIQQFDKAKSYSEENQARAEYWMEEMAIWNANLLCY